MATLNSEREAGRESCLGGGKTLLSSKLPFTRTRRAVTGALLLQPVLLTGGDKYGYMRKMRQRNSGGPRSEEGLLDKEDLPQGMRGLKPLALSKVQT